MSEERIKHLEFVQDVATRMNANSFQIKELTIIVVSATLALYASTQNCDFILVGILPTAMFWLLDAYYLTLERKFRGIYDDVACVSEKPKTIKPFAMDPDLYTQEQFRFRKALWSTTIWRMYLTIILVLIGIFIYLKLS